MPSTLRPQPLWLLDIDGVIAPDLGRGKKLDRAVWREWRHATVADLTGQAYDIDWSPIVADLITHAVAMGVEVIFLSSWLGSSKAVTEALGLQPLPWLDFDTDPDVMPWPKLQLARQVAVNRPLIWTDDHIFRERGAEDWARQRQAPTSWHCPQSRIGLTQRMVREIGEFIDRYTQDFTPASVSIKKEPLA